MSSSSYHRVPSAESSDPLDDAATTAEDAASSASDGSTASSRHRTASERVHDKIMALLWVLLAVGVAYVSNFWNVITLQVQATAEPTFQGTNATLPPGTSYPAVPNRLILQAAALCLGTILLFAAYLLVYLPCVKGLSDPSVWHVYCPRVVPSIWCLGVLTFLLLIRGTWPVWGCLSPLLISVQMLGIVFSTQLIPWPC